MLHPKVEEALNAHLALEMQASHFYLSIASWCDARGYEGAAAFFYKQSHEESYEHFSKMFRYINDAGGHAIVPAVKQPESNFEALFGLFEGILQEEKNITAAIYALCDLCLAERDYATFNFLQWYVVEQQEEEQMVQRILDKIKIIGEERRGPYFLDKYLAKLAAGGSE